MSKRPNISCLRQTLYYCELRNRLRGPFKAKKAKKSCLPQTLILLWTEREAARGLSKSKRPKISCLWQTPYYCEQRDRLTSDGGRCPFKAKKAKKSCLPQTIILRDRLTEPFQSQKGKKILPAAGTYIIVNWEIGWGGPLKAKKAKKILPAAGTYIIMNWERGWGRPFNAKMFKKFLPAAGT